MKFTKIFRGCPNGEIFPVDYAPGEECPLELEEAAISCGVVEVAGGGVPKKHAGRAKTTAEMAAPGEAAGKE